MDFELGKDLADLQEVAREFARREFTSDQARDCVLTGRYPREIQQRAGEAGLIGVHLPKEYGGRGAGLLGSVLVIEALCAADTSLGMAITLCSLGSQFTWHLGTAEQKEMILPRVTAGQMITGVGFTEPDHGSDITDLSTTAAREGDHFRINGVKTLISNGLEAGLFTILCKTDQAASPPHRGFSLLVVERDKEGLSIVDLGEKMGLHNTSTCELTFKDVMVPESNLLGQEGRGFYHTMEFLDQTRVEVAAQALGCAQAALDKAVEHLKTRRQSGKPLAEFQVNRHKVAEMATKVEGARLLVYEAARNYDVKGPDARIASMAKYYAARVAVEVADEMIQLFGGRGYFTMWDVHRIYRDARVTEIYEGAREIQKNTIANALLK